MQSDPAGIINLTNTLKRQGLDPTKIYHGKVVDNDDPRKLGRIKARIKHIFDGIKDKDLPWCIPKFKHMDGAYNPGGNHKKRSGTFYVPKKKHSVGITFQDGDPHRPIWEEYTVDEDCALPERKKNYPDRAVWRFSNGAYLIVDTKTSEIFINNPGDTHMTVMGDMSTYVKGDQTHVISDDYFDIDPYMFNAPDLALNQLKANPQKLLKWLGALKFGSGNFHQTVTGDQTFLVKGNRKTMVTGYDWTEVGAFQREYVKLGHIHVSSRMDNN